MYFMYGVDWVLWRIKLEAYLMPNPVYMYIGIMVRTFANCSGDQGSIPGQVIPKTQKMVLDTSLLNTKSYKVFIKGKWTIPAKGIVASSTPQSISY